MRSFDIEIFDPNPPRMVPDTAKIVSALQNTTLHPLDLLVRESVQNSLDAAIDSDRKGDVRVVFGKGEFDVDRFAGFLGEESGGKLKEWLRRNKVGNNYISIRDSRCSGLTGDPKDNKSNIYKLVYGFLDGKDAENATAGGSFGVGKTVFLHFGIGFVCYYSRTESGHRLSLFYCKNNEKKNIFEKHYMPFQLAWWGSRESRNCNAVYPIEDEAIISKFLNIFDIAPYQDGDTGTTVIIPFFDQRVASEEKSQFTPWLASVDDYLRFSVLKWYVPRFRGDLKTLSNDDGSEFRDYNWGRYLRCMFPDRKHLSLVSDDSVSVPERKIFTLIRDLYDVALGKIDPPENTHRIIVELKNSPKNNIYFHYSTIGWFAIKKINFSEGEFEGTHAVLKSLAPEGDVEDRKGFVLYCRKPGMIMSYDDSWGRVLSQASVSGSEFFIGIFVVNSDNRVFSDPGHLNLICPLDQLFRETEKSDHYGWPADATSHGMKMINSIISQLKTQVAKRFSIQEDDDKTTPKGDISRGLGSVFMSGRTGFGGSQLFAEGNGGLDVENSHDGSGEGKKKTKKTTVKLGNPSFKIEGGMVNVSIPAQICAAAKDPTIKLEVAVETDGAPLTAEKWNPNDGMYPIKAVSFVVEDSSAREKVAFELYENAATFLIDMSSCVETTVKCVFTYTISRSDMSTVVVRKEA